MTTLGLKPVCEFEIKIGDFASTHTWVIRSGCLVRIWVADIIALDILYPCNLQDGHLFKTMDFAIRDIFIHLFKNYTITPQLVEWQLFESNNCQFLKFDVWHLFDKIKNLVFKFFSDKSQ